MATDLSQVFEHDAVVSWDQHYKERVNPVLMTKLVHDVVPVVRYVGWYVKEVEEGYVHSVLPLNYESTNQHGSHQGAMMALAADYTGGGAISSVLRGVPIGGVHVSNSEECAAVWLASMHVKYFAPSSGHLSVTCRIPEEEYRVIQRRFFNGRRVLIKLNIEFHSNADHVATAEMVYFAQQAKQLRPSADSQSVSTLFKHKLKASARMIAGLRGGLGGSSKIRIHCAHSREVAGPHGKLLAERLNSVLPQLQDMVLARTQHVDEVLTQGLENGIEQVVLMGAGLDVRAYRYGELAKRASYFELDLAEMLEERKRVISKLKVPKLERYPLAMNFETQTLDDVLLNAKAFDPTRPTAFIYEGCSMYFEADDNSRMLTAARDLMLHPQSFIWVDFVKTGIVTGEFKHDAVRAFLKGMEELGEAFVFGVDDPTAYMKRLGFDSAYHVASSEFFKTTDPVAGMYNFVVARCDGRR